MLLNPTTCSGGGCHSTLQAAADKERELLEKEGPRQRCQPGSRISVKPLPCRTHTHTHTSAGFMGGFKRLFQQTDIKRGLGSEYRSQQKKKALPHHLQYSSLIPSLSLSPPPSPTQLPSSPGPSSAVLCSADWISGSR